MPSKPPDPEAGVRVVRYQPAHGFGWWEFPTATALLAALGVGIGPESLMGWAQAPVVCWAMVPLTYLAGWMLLSLLDLRRTRRAPAIDVSIDPLRQVILGEHRLGAVDGPPQGRIMMFDLDLSAVAGVVILSRPVAWRPAMFWKLVPRCAHGWVPAFLLRSGEVCLVAPQPTSRLAEARVLAEQIDGFLRAAERDRPVPRVAGSALNADPLRHEAPRPRGWLARLLPHACMGMAALLLVLASTQAGALGWTTRNLSSSIAALNVLGVAQFIVGNPAWVETLAQLAAHRMLQPISTDALFDVALSPADASGALASNSPEARTISAPPPGVAQIEAGASDPLRRRYFVDLQGAEIMMLHAIAENNPEQLRQELGFLLNYYRADRRASDLALRRLAQLAITPVRGVTAGDVVQMLRCLEEMGRPQEADTIAVLLDDTQSHRLSRFNAFERTSVRDATQRAVAIIRARGPAPDPEP